MHQAKHLVRDTLLVLLGNLILAFGVAVFAVPSNLIVAGATGIALIICEFIPVNYATVVFVINMVMLLLGFIVLGKKFAAGTILSSLIFPFFLAMFEAIPQLQHLTSDMLLSAIYAGLFTGLGCGIVFRVGYSTGGMDIPPIIMNKKLHISLGVCVYLFDVVVLLGQSFFTSFEGILYGIITVFITAIVLDKVTIFGERNLQVLVISAHHEEIVFSYLIHDYDLSLPDRTDMSHSRNSDNYTLTVSMTPFALDGKDNPTQDEVIDSSFRLINTTYAFDNGSTRIDKVGVCHDYYRIIIESYRGSHDIGAGLSMNVDSNHKDNKFENAESSSQSWIINYDTCPGDRFTTDHEYEYQNHVGYSIRGAVSIVIDNDSYKDSDKANGLYSSTVTLTLTDNG